MLLLSYREVPLTPLVCTQLLPLEKTFDDDWIFCLPKLEIAARCCRYASFRFRLQPANSTHTNILRGDTANIFISNKHSGRWRFKYLYPVTRFMRRWLQADARNIFPIFWVGHCKYFYPDTDIFCFVRVSNILWLSILYGQVTRRACLTWGICTGSSSCATSRGSTSRSASPRPTACPRPAASSTSATTRPPPPTSPGAAASVRRTWSWSPGRGGAWGRGPGAGPPSTGAGWSGATPTCHTACSGTLVMQSYCHHTVMLSHSHPVI